MYISIEVRRYQRLKIEERYGKFLYRDNLGSDRRKADYKTLEM
jgi:hypothetical protein